MRMIPDMAKKTLVVGNSRCAAVAARELADCDMPVIVSVNAETEIPPLTALQNKNNIEILKDTRITSCRGHAGNYLVQMQAPDGLVKRNVNAVIIAEEPVRRSLPEGKNSTAGLNIMPLSEIRMRMETEGSRFQGKTIVFFNSLHTENLPFIAREVMETAIHLRQADQARPYILTGNLKVAGNGLEALYRKARETGIIFVKFTDTLPAIKRHPEQGYSLIFSDALTGEDFRLAPDVTVADEIITPSPYFNDLARIFGLHQDEAGFLQTGNVRREGVLTNRKGIFAAGPSRGPAACPQDEADARQAVFRVMSLHDNAMPVCEHPAEIQAGCIRCLTCYRSCPYQAILIDTTLSIMPEACEGCGICAAECPRGAISIAHLSASAMAEAICKNTAGQNSPGILIFCCARSAAAAGDAAQALGHALPENVKMIQVPCAGAISIIHMLTAFSKGADGVLVLTCHEGNCHAEKGNQHAMNRAAHAKRILFGMGIDQERLRIRTLSSNMGKEFADIVHDFADYIQRGEK